MNGRIWCVVLIAAGLAAGCRQAPAPVEMPPPEVEVATPPAS